MEKVIVVGVDNSEAAKRAAQLAADWAKPLQARLLLVHAVPSTAMPADAVAFGAQLLAAHRLQGEALLDTLVNELERPDLKVEKRLVETGGAAEILCDVAQEVGAALIVVGHTGAGRVSRMLLGSVADRVTHISPVPVLVAR